MVKWGLKITAIAALAVGLTGCGTTHYRGTDSGVVPNGVRQQSLDGNRMGIHSRALDNTRNRSMTSTSLHSNTRMEVSEEISRKLADMAEVDSATVLLTDRNAYVAVVLADERNVRDHGSTYTGNSVGQLNTPGTHIGTHNTLNQPRRMGNAMNPMIRTDSTTDHLGRRDAVTGHEVTSDIKEKIARKVESIDPRIEHVYVSANPDFIDRMRDYGSRFRNGQPLSGLVTEFNTMVERIFPTDETTRMDDRIAK